MTNTDELIVAIGNLNHDDDAHWTVAGLPNLNVIREAIGHPVSRKEVEAAGLGDVRRITEDERAGVAVTSGDANDVPDPKAVSEPQKAPEVSAVEAVTAKIIAGLDELDRTMTPEAVRYQPELYDVFRLYQANKPSILERQRRLATRRSGGY
jgi:hypothetical protein